jgi:hypothetical protein
MWTTRTNPKCVMWTTRTDTEVWVLTAQRYVSRAVSNLLLLSAILLVI